MSFHCNGYMLLLWDQVCNSTELFSFRFDVSASILLVGKACIDSLDVCSPKGWSSC